jgi:predicted dehydrogenase
MTTPLTRRRFLVQSGAAATACALGPRVLVGMPAGGKLRLATVGCGGMGGADLRALSGHPAVEVVALCDVDQNNLNNALKKFPNAKPFRDYRKMFDAMPKDIDIVNVGTPDHMHAAASMTALQLGKHVYCQKPLTHDVHESRRLAEVAKEKRLQTQMGIQIHSSSQYRLAVRLIQDGAIGKVKEVHSWSGKKWGYNGPRPEGSDPVPPNLDWDLWLGTAPVRPYKKGLYHPGNWRKWLDFGCGTMGDMSIHILDPVACALSLTQPKTIVSDSPEPPKESFATRNKVRYTFPGTKYSVDPLSLTWYDGDERPDSSTWPLAKDKKGNKRIPGQGSMFIGEKGFMLLPHIGNPVLLPQEQFKDYAVPKVSGGSHWHLWVDACRGKGTPSANFNYAGPLSEFVLLGVVANRVPGKKLTWNASALKIDGSSEAQALIKRTYRKGWETKGL